MHRLTDSLKSAAFIIAKQDKLKIVIEELDQLIRKFAIKQSGEDYMPPFNSRNLTESINNMSKQIRDATK